MDIVQSETPLVYSALVGKITAIDLNRLKINLTLAYAIDSGERDQYMANAIRSRDSAILVGVVGMAHVAGMERSLVSSGYKLVKSNCQPL